MGEDSKATGMVAYIGDKPVGVCEEIPALTELDPVAGAEAVAGGTVTAEKLAQVTETIHAAFDALAPTFEQLARSLGRFAAAIALGYELQKAIRWAEVYNRKLAHIYHHTKKRRIRKKYAKRILAWYREEVDPPC